MSEKNYLSQSANKIGFKWSVAWHGWNNNVGMILWYYNLNCCFLFTEMNQTKAINTGVFFTSVENTQKIWGRTSQWYKPPKRTWKWKIYEIENIFNAFAFTFKTFQKTLHLLPNVLPSSEKQSLQRMQEVLRANAKFLCGTQKSPPPLPECWRSVQWIQILDPWFI